MSPQNALATICVKNGWASGMKWQFLLKQSTTVRITTCHPRAGEIWANVHPGHLRHRHRHRHQQPCWMQMLGLVLLACGATANKILDHRTKVRSVEISAEPVRALDALVAVIMDGGH